MPRSGPRTVRRYSEEFKRAAVRSTQELGIQVQAVANCIRSCAEHQVMREQLSRASMANRPQLGSGN